MEFSLTYEEISKVNLVARRH